MIKYYKNIDIPYDNYCNIIKGFPKYYKVSDNKFTLIDTYEMINVTYYNRPINVSKLTPIDESEWNTIESVVKVAYQKRRDLYFTR